MKKIFILPLAMLISFFSTANNPDEGMWIPLHLKNMNEADMKKLGLELGADDLYNVAKSSLKDAIVRLNNGGCTAEIVSGEGLVFTNHHCAYGAIWDAIDKNLINKEGYKKNGFWTMSKDEEIGGLQLNAGILMSIEKVTDKIYPELEKTDSEEARSAKFRELASALETEAEGDNQFIDAQLKEMFAGNEYYLYTYKVYQDVRLVGSPPESIGKFGGDTDNWMWPRHTGDFAILRIYADDKNEPAEYSENNKPYAPKHFLPVSIEDKKPGDFSMIMGYPGTTERYLTSYDLETKLNYTLPARVETRAVVLDVMGKYMAQDDKLDTRLKSKRARIANYWKLWSGQMQMARLYDLTSEQEKEDQELKAWIEDDNRRINRFGSVLAGIENHNKMVQEVDPYTAAYTEGFFNSETFIAGVRAAIAANTQVQLKALEGKKDELGEDYAKQKEALERRLNGLLESVNTFKTNLFDLSTVTDQSWPNAYPHEREMLVEICQMMYKKHKKESHPAFLTAMYAGEGDDLTEIENAVNAILDKSFIYNQKKFDKMMAKFKASKALKDPFVQLSQNIYNTYQALAQQSGAAYKDLSKHRRLYFEALMKMKSDKSFYPDANSSMRLTYGTIIPYQPRDGVFYTYKTSHHGVLEKNNPNDPEFQNSDRTLDMFKNHKFGRYGVNDSLTLCFLTNHDITGGNSGSPVINGKGHLIGIAFDGNWEAATSDFLVMPTYNRTISVDIRYVLWVIDEFADCNRLIKEMKVIEPAAKPNKAESNGDQAPAPSR